MSCRHNQAMMYGVRCLNCQREEKHVMELIKSRLRNVCISEDPDQAVRDVNDALAGMALPYGYRAEAVITKNGTALSLSVVQPVTIEGVLTYEQP